MSNRSLPSTAHWPTPTPMLTELLLVKGKHPDIISILTARRLRPEPFLMLDRTAAKGHARRGHERCARVWHRTPEVPSVAMQGIWHGHSRDCGSPTRAIQGSQPLYSPFSGAGATTACPDMMNGRTR